MRRYTFKEYEQEHMARAIGLALPISFKQSVEICRFIKNKSVNDSKRILGDVVKGKVAVPFRKYNFDLGHKKKIGPGRYPKTASEELIKLIETVETNAQFKGLNTSNLVIAHIAAHKSAKVWHVGRKPRRKMKRTDVEIVVKEAKADKPEEKVSKK